MTTYIYTNPNRLVIERDGYAAVITDDTLKLSEIQQGNVKRVGNAFVSVEVVSLDDVENLGNYTTKLQPKIEYRPGMKVKGKTLKENNPPWKTIILVGSIPLQINSQGNWEYGSNRTELVDEVEYEVIYMP